MKTRSIFPVLILIIIFAALLTACSGAGPEDAVVDYLNALVNKDESTLSAVSCAEWEPDALLELDSFQAVTVRLENVACEKTGDEDGAAIVLCQGKLIATYNTEDMELNLSDRSYKVIEQEGNFLVCGYK